MFNERGNEMGYPDTAEKRKAGMAAFRKQLLAAHERIIAEGNLKPRDLKAVTEYRDCIKAAQIKHGEVSA